MYFITQETLTTSFVISKVMMKVFERQNPIPLQTVHIECQFEDQHIEDFDIQNTYVYIYNGLAYENHPN